jgi:hypothetical protein
MCWFCQAAAVLPYSCNSVWSAPPPARWGNSVLSTALSLRKLAQQFSIPLLWEADLLHHCSQILLPVPPSLVEIFGSLLHPCSPRLVQCSTPPPLSVVDYNSLFMFLSFVQGGSICPGAVLDYVPGDGWESPVWCLLLTCWVCIYTDSFEIGWWGETK